MPPKTMKPMAASFATRKITCIRVDSRTLWTLTTNAVTEVINKMLLDTVNLNKRKSQDYLNCQHIVQY